jgi:frataxin-like iron-binding protein CyaY
MQEDEFHKLADETIHDLLEKLEVVIWSSNLST